MLGVITQHGGNEVKINKNFDEDLLYFSLSLCFILNGICVSAHRVTLFNGFRSTSESSLLPRAQV